MSKCKHDGGFYLVNTKEGESVGVVCYDCGKGLMIIISEQQKENDALRAQVEAMAKQENELQEIADKWRERALKAEKEKTELWMHSAMLRNVLEAIWLYNEIPIAKKALSALPSESAEKVGKLVAALEQVQKAHVESRFDHEDGMSIEVFTRDIHIVVDEALAEWEGKP